MHPRCLTLCIAIIALALTGLNQIAAATEPPPQYQSVHVPQSRQWTMHSTHNGRAYEIFVAIPDSPAPPQGYATLYVLDGNHMFLTTVDAVRAHARRRDVDAKMHALVVGIGYPDGVDIAAARAFDLTPDVAESGSRQSSGGADAFMDFIVRELKPAIVQAFPVNPARQALIGHSLGGRLTLDMLTKNTDAFQTYVAMSASFWFGQHDLVRRVTAFVQARRNGALPATPLRVLLTAGEFEQQPRPEEWQRDHARAAQLAENLSQRGQITHAQHAANALATLPGIAARFQEIAGEDHGSVVPAAIGRAVRFILLDGRNSDASPGTPLPAPPQNKRH